MVRPADIVADCLGGMGTEKDRAGMADQGDQRLRVGGAKLQMLRRDPVRQFGGVGEVAGYNHRAEFAPACTGDLRPLQPFQQAFDRAGDLENYLD